MKIKILTENRVRDRGLQAEHGLSFWLEVDDKTTSENEKTAAGQVQSQTGEKSQAEPVREKTVCHILFDTGQSDLYARNADKMGVDLSKADYLVLSHGHYDHGGGIPFYPFWQHGPRLIAHPAAFELKIKGDSKGQQTDIGLPWKEKDYPEIARHIMLNTHTMQINDCCYVCANIPVTRDFEVEAAKQFSSHGVSDEQFLLLDRPQGLVVVVGCSHPGIISMLDFAEKCFPDKPIAAVIGGMHLSDVSQDHLDSTVQALKEKQIPLIVPLHCTGTEAVIFMRNKLGSCVHLAQTGDTLEML